LRRAIQHYFGFTGILAALLLAGCGKATVRLPFDSSNPVIYDNDSAVDVYTDEYLLALASLGEIRLKGMITTISIVPDNQWVKPEDYEREVSSRQKLATAAKASGFKNVPVPVRGPMGMLKRPDSGRIRDTVPFNSEGTRLIVEEARKATKEKPLVIVAGGQLTSAADAYLMDPSIADKVVVSWLCLRNHDMGQYNGWADPWAAYIVLKKLRLVQFGSVPTPKVQKSDLKELPSSPLQKFMYDAYLPGNPPGPGDHDGDAPPAIALMRPDYPLEVKSATFGHFQTQDGHEIPVFQSDSVTLGRRAFFGVFRRQERSRTLVVTNADESVATSEWWRAIRSALGGS
jgi:hypothetical protein